MRQSLTAMNDVVLLTSVFILFTEHGRESKKKRKKTRVRKTGEERPVPNHSFEVGKKMDGWKTYGLYLPQAMMMLVLMMGMAAATLTSCSLGCPSDARTGRGGPTFHRPVRPSPVTSEVRTLVFIASGAFNIVVRGVFKNRDLVSLKWIAWTSMNVKYGDVMWRFHTFQLPPCVDEVFCSKLYDNQANFAWY